MPGRGQALPLCYHSSPIMAFNLRWCYFGEQKGLSHPVVFWGYSWLSAWWLSSEDPVWCQESNQELTTCKAWPPKLSFPGPLDTVILRDSSPNSYTPKKKIPGFLFDRSEGNWLVRVSSQNASLGKFGADENQLSLIWDFIFPLSSLTLSH